MNPALVLSFVSALFQPQTVIRRLLNYDRILKMLCKWSKLQITEQYQLLPNADEPAQLH